MLPRFSVKKPFTVLVAVILVLILGVVSFTGMTTDLLPSMELPYVVVVTTYPGASPEKVEAAVTRPLEAVLGTTGGINTVQSVSSENSSMIILEFEQGTNMDSAMIELSGNIDLVAGQLDDAVGAPMMLKMSPDMLPVVAASVDMEGQDVTAVSKLVSDTVQPAFERLDGVASVSATGLVEQQVSVQMDGAKIDALNRRVLAGVDEKLADAQSEILDGKAELASGKQKLADGKAALQSQKDSGLGQLASASAQVDAAAAQVSALLSEEKTLEANQKAFEMEQAGYQQAQQTYAGLNTALAQAKAGAVESAKAGILAQVNGALAQFGMPAAGTYEEAVALYAQAQQAAAAMGQTLPDLPDPAALAAGVPGSVEELLALDAAAFEALKAQLAGSAPQMAELTQESLAQLKAAVEKAAARLPEIATELANIETRKAVIAAMKPQLESALQQAQAGYAQLESGKMTAVNEITKGEVTLSSTEEKLKEAEQQLDSAEEQFMDARDQAYKQASLDGILTPELLSNLLMAQNFSMPAGYITEGTEQYLLKVGDAFASVQELEDTVLMHIDAGGVGDVRLSDVATVSLSSNAGESYAKVNGNDGVMLMFQKQSTASTAAVSDKIGDAIRRLEEENPGLHITPLMDQGDYIDMVVGSVLENLLLGGLLAILVLILFLRDLRPTLIVALSIPFSLLFAVTLMYFSGVTLNLISLSGLALGVGMLVDNSIVVIENIYRLRSQGVPAAKAAVQGASEVAGAIFASTLTTICVFLPIVFTQGLSRQLFTDMGLTIAYSLLASLAVALTLVPALGSSALRTAGEKPHPLFDRFVGAYEKVLRWSLSHKAPVLCAALALLVFSGVMVTRMGTAFIPAMDSPQMSATLTMPKEADTRQTYEMADEVLARMCAVDGVQTVGAMEGGGMMGMGGSSSGHSISFYILLDDGRKVSNVEVKDAILAATADLDAEVSVAESTMDLSMLGGSGVELVVSGQDLDRMNEAAEDLRAILRGTEGLIDVSEAAVTDTPETRVTIDKDAAMRRGLTVAQIYSELAGAVSNEKQATTLTMGADSLPVVVLRPQAQHISRDSLAGYTFTVTNSEGEEEQIPLSAIASITEADSVPSIRRENNTRTLSVTAGVDEEHNIGLVSREVEKALRDYDAPAGVTVTLEGENENINQALGDLVKMLLLAVAFIYLIMVAQFQSLMSPFIVMFTIPLAFTGGLLALLLTGKELSIIAMLGFLVLSGVVVNNGIVFVDSINQLRLAGLGRREAIVRTGRTRIRPVLMTALTTILAMSTMALGIGQGAEMTQPLAIVAIGGLSYATVLTLVVVPVLYDSLLRRPMKQIDVDDGEVSA